MPYSSLYDVLPLGNTLISDRFVRYIVVLIAFAHKDLGKSDAEINIVRTRDIII
jgi:hypothetical protein